MHEKLLPDASPEEEEEEECDKSTCSWYSWGINLLFFLIAFACFAFATVCRAETENQRKEKTNCIDFAAFPCNGMPLEAVIEIVSSDDRFYTQCGGFTSFECLWDACALSCDLRKLAAEAAVRVELALSPQEEY